MLSRSTLGLARVRSALPPRSLTRSASNVAGSATASLRATSSSVRFGVAALGGAAFLGATALTAPVHLDGEAMAKRRTYSERMKRTGDGSVVIQRPVEVEEELDAEQESTSEDGAFASLEAEASQQSAFDPETNTINWDCPCLGGMAQGPCGEEFKEAFSCFVFSEKEPKGIECVPAFQIMQDCFRRHPEVYAEELKDDEWEEAQRDGAPPETGADLSEDQPGSDSKPE